MSSTFITKNIQGVEELIDYQFTNRNLISEALLAAGSYLPDISFGTDGNKNLALVEDAVLKLVLVLHGYNKNHSKRTIGDALTVKSSNLYLAEKGFLNKLERFIFKNPSQGNIVSSGLMATTAEAIL